MGKAPAFQLYASDFYMDTSGWTATQVGIYFRLLMFEWINGSIPNDTEKLARIAQIDHGNFLKCYRPTVEGKFLENGNGVLINRRLEEVRKKQSKYLESQLEKGKKGGRPIKSHGLFLALTDEKPKESSSSSSSLIINNNGGDEKPEKPAALRRWYRNEIGNYVCFQCQKSFMEFNNLQIHLGTHL